MTLHWQDIAALGLVALALAYLGRLAYRAVSKHRAERGCATGCGTCPSQSAATERDRGEPLVTIGSPRVRSTQEERRP